jgi:phosphatidylethanolamine N-methyltransferase
MEGNIKSLLNTLPLNLSLENHFIEAILYTFLIVTLNSVLPYIQYKYHFISLVMGDIGRGADFLAVLLIHIGTFRNYAFMEAIIDNLRYDLGKLNYLSYSVGGLCILSGVILVALSFQRLGLRGMYFGDHFGFLFKKKVMKFPYNYLENPHYIGSNMIYFGISLWFRSFVGLVLTLIIIAANEFVYYFYEKKRLVEFYPGYQEEQDEQLKANN